MNWIVPIFLVISSLLAGCGGKLKNDLDPVKVTCGAAAVDAGKELIAFRLPEGRLSDFYPVA